MVNPSSNVSGKAANGRNGSNTSATPRPSKPIPAQKTKENEPPKQSTKPEVNGLTDYRLGDCLGKGAFGSVYRALHWGTGETVAVKRVKVADLPKNDLRVIMLEIDLLKNLNHPNIVKYHGFEKSADYLHIILEYCENGSLHFICRKFGKFPENLVALYMSQVLHGLLYLHEQGVIHRDIKGANILTTKEGLVKLADFGVAAKATGLHESSVVGTPYWMAPEVIELSGATTASDIWSLGCTVIELLDGKPPYHKLQPMPALFRIVNDDHPPLPESISPAVQDFLMQCFQKDPNLRVSAKKLLKHPWIVNAKRADSVIPIKPTKFDEAVKSVQQWNEALKSPDPVTFRRDSQGQPPSPVPTRAELVRDLASQNAPAGKVSLDIANHRVTTDPYRSSSSEEQDNWDDDFASSISSSALQLPHLRPVDNFGGLLSAERLKAFATIEAPAYDGAQAGDSADDPTVRSPLAIPRRDVMETVKPTSPTKETNLRIRRDQLRRHQQSHPAQPKTQILRAPIKPASQPPRPHPPKRSSSVFKDDPVEDYDDLVEKDETELNKKIDQFLRFKQSDAFTPKFTHVSDLKSVPRSTMPIKPVNGIQARPMQSNKDREASLHRTRSEVEMMKYAEKLEDEDFSDIFGNDEASLTRAESESGSEKDIMSMLNSKFSSNSWLVDDEDDDDPFAQLEEDLDEMDLETKVARDKHARLCTVVEGLVGALKTSQTEDTLFYTAEQLMQVLFESTEMRSVVITSHGLLPILEVLDNCQDREISLMLLKIINVIILESVEVQETLCFVGGIPIITKYAAKKYSSEIRLEAAAFVRQMYQTSTLTLQMFISCGGLNVLVEFLEEDYEAERDLVLIGVNGVWSVFELQGPTPKNDFCRIFSRSSALYPLSLVLNQVLDEHGELAELVEGRIANIFLIFSQAENHVKESVADRMVLKRVLKDLPRMSPNHQITMLKFIKNLSMLATTLDSLHSSGAIDQLTDLLASGIKGPQFHEISNQILNIMFNLCRLSKKRQEDAALCGIIPLLQKIVKTERPLKEFALPILCDMAHSGNVGRKLLWQNKGLDFYVSLLVDPYWQVTALDAIFIWLQEETAKVENHLLNSSFSQAVIDGFTHSGTDGFENLLEPLQKLLRLSPPLASTLARPEMFARAGQKLHTKKAVVRGNLLRVIRSICESSEEQGALINRYRLYEIIKRLAESDPAILVRNMASDLVRSAELSIKTPTNDMLYRANRRTSSTAITPPALHSSSSQPSTPQQIRTTANTSSGYFQVSSETRTRGSRPSLSTTGTPRRPVSRGDSMSTRADPPSNVNRPPSTRTYGMKGSRSSVTLKKDEKDSVAPSGSSRPSTSSILSPRRRRQTSGTGS